MVAVGLAAISATGEIALPHMTVFAVGLVVGWTRDETVKPLGAGVWNTAVLVLFLVCGFYSFASSEAFIKGVVYFLAYVLLIRLISRKDARDTRWLFLLSFLTICAASILTISMNFLAFLMAYMVAASWALMAFNLNMDISTENKDAAGINLGNRLLKSAGLTSVMIMIATAIMFFFIPRMSSGFFAWASRASPKISGFSDNIKLGEVGKIKMNRRTVMRIAIEGEDSPRADILWRGIALDGFDGTSWFVKDTGAVHIPMKESAIFWVKKKRPRWKLTRQEIFMEPMKNPVLFAASEPVAFQMYEPGNIPSNPTQLISFLKGHYTDYYSLPLISATYDRIKYYAYSDLEFPPEDELRKAWDNKGKGVFKDYTTLPYLAPKVRELAVEITGDSDSVYDKVTAVRDYLLANYSYSLEAAGRKTDSPVTDFLFETREGHCEYFATTMTVLLRTQGIPTRVVNGFQRGEWNPYENYYHVRQSDAHSWVEVYFPGYGWITFDPTPPSSRMYGDEYGMFGKFSSYFDSWRFKWNRWVVDFSFQDQVDISNQVMLRSSKTSSHIQLKMKLLRSKLKAFLMSIQGISVVSAILLSLTVALIIKRVFRIKFRRFRFIPGREVGEQEIRSEVSMVYESFIKRLKRKGLKKEPHETPLEFARFASPLERAARTKFIEATELYYRLRYSPEPVTMDKLTELQTTLKQTGSLL